MFLHQGGNLNYMESPLLLGDRMFTDFVGFPLSAPTTRNSHTKAMAASSNEFHIITFIMERHVYLKTLPLIVLLSVITRCSYQITVLFSKFCMLYSTWLILKEDRTFWQWHTTTGMLSYCREFKSQQIQVNARNIKKQRLTSAL